MSQEDREVIDLCDRNSRERNLEEAARIKKALREEADAAARRAARRRERYRSASAITFFAGGMSAVMGVWIWRMYESGLGFVLAVLLAAVLVMLGYQFDDESR